MVRNFSPDLIYQISKFLEKSSFAIYSLLNIDLKKATADDVEKKWFDNFEKLNFKFPKVNLVRVYPYSGKGWSGLNNGYFIPIPNKPNEYLQANKEGKYGRGTFGIWPYLANDNKIDFTWNKKNQFTGFASPLSKLIKPYLRNKDQTKSTALPVIGLYRTLPSSL